MKPALLALALLFAQDDTDAKLKEFAETMKSAKSDGERIKAIDAFAATRSLKAALKIATVVASPYPEAVRVAAADAVGRIGDIKASAPLLAYVNGLGNLLQSEVPSKKEEQKVAEAAVRAIGTLKDRSATPRLTAMLISANIPLMGEAVRALAKIRDPQCMDGLLKLHYAANAPEGVGATNVRKPLAPDTLMALRRITGQRLTTPDEWNKWYRSVGGRIVVPPEESLGGLPPEVRAFAVYEGKGEIATLRKFDLVLLNPENWTKDDLSQLFRPIALTGEPKAAMDKGFAGFCCNPDEAADLRKKFPRALIVSRGGAARAGANANAILVDDLDLKKPDEKVLDELRDAFAKHDTPTLAVFVSEKKDDLQAAAVLDKKYAFLFSYVSPDKDHSTITAPGAP